MWAGDYGSPVHWSVVERSVLNEPPEGYTVGRVFITSDGANTFTNSFSKTDPADPGPYDGFCK